MLSFFSAFKRFCCKSERRAEVSDLTEERLERLEVTADTVLQELAKIAFANMGDYLTIGADGSITVDISQATTVQAAALADLRIDEYSFDKRRLRRTRIRLASKTRALELLGKHLKLWTDRAQSEHHINLAEEIKKGRQRVLSNMSDAELNDRIKELEGEMSRRHPSVNLEFIPGMSDEDLKQLEGILERQASQTVE